MDISQRQMIILLPKEALSSTNFMFALNRAYDVLSRSSKSTAGQELVVKEDVVDPSDKGKLTAIVICRGRKTILSRREISFPYNMAATIGALSEEFNVGLDKCEVPAIFH